MLTFEQIEDCFPEGNFAEVPGLCELPTQWIHEFARAIEAEVMGPLPPIERDEGMDRTYIPMPGGWEIQTKGKGSSFRICNTKTGKRWLIADKYIHKALEQMALDSRMETKNNE